MTVWQSLFGDKLVTKAGDKATADVLGGKSAVGIYFSAHWCPPCRSFTPKLIESYNDALQGKGRGGGEDRSTLRG